MIPGSVSLASVSCKTAKNLGVKDKNWKILTIGRKEI